MCPSMDLMPNALRNRRLKFVEKQKPQEEADSDPKVEEALFIVPM